MPNTITERLRAEANAIDDTGDVELRVLLADAAEELERFAFAGRYSADMYNQMKDAREEALAEVEQLKAQNARLRGAPEYSSTYLNAGPLNTIGYHSKAHMEMIDALEEYPAEALAEIQARAVETILNDLRADMPDTNTARRIFQRLQLRVDVLRAKQPITNPTENSSQLVIGDSNSDRGGSCYDREVLGQNNEGDTVKQVRQAVTDYYLALDKRQHGAVAQNEAFNKIERVLGMDWERHKAIEKEVQRG